jgi:transposase-like protein
MADEVADAPPEAVRLYIEETWTYYRLPRMHHKHMKSTNMLERIRKFAGAPK